MAANPDDLGLIEKAVNDGAGQVRALWFSFLGFETYLAVTAGSVTHRMLLEEAALKLPLLNVDLPLVGFFIIAPLIFLIFHFYLLLQMATFARKLALYNELLSAEVRVANDREKMRRRLDLFPMVQMVAGAIEDRTPLNSFLLRTVVVFTAVIWPVVVLLLMQLAFLPDHSAPVTWLHRIVIGADLIAIIFLWSDVSRPEWRFSLRSGAGFRRYFECGSYGIVLIFSIAIAGFPGEWFAGLFSPLPELVLQGPINDATGKPTRPFSNVLVLTGDKLFEEGKPAGQDKPISLRGRDLSGAIFVRADLRKADFTGANLIGAVFDRAQLSEAHFGCAEKVNIKASSTDMFGVAPRDDGPQVYGWPGDHCTWLSGASLAGVDLRGANLSGARLQGAHFNQSQLQGANFTDADLTGAMFFGARLDGATLDSAQLFGVQFNSTRLRGASLVSAHIEGAGMFQTDFTAAALQDAYVYRTRGKPKSLALAKLDGVEIAAAPFGVNGYRAWLETRLAQVPAGEIRDAVKQRLGMLDPADKSEERSLTPPETWWELWPQGPDLEVPVAAALCDLACKPENAPYVARALITNGRLGAAGERLATLAARLRDPKLCPGAAGLGPADWLALDRLVAQSQGAR